MTPRTGLTWILVPLALAAACTTEDGSTADGSTGPSGPDAFEMQTTTATKRMFVTSQQYLGNFGGLDGADQICTTLAANAGLSGKFEAWLSSSVGSPSTRFTHSGGNYTLVDGTLVAKNWDTLIEGRVAHAIDVDERGAVVVTPHDDCWGRVNAWSNTNADGTPLMRADESCADWSANGTIGATGEPDATDEAWSEGDCFMPCNASSALYCVEQ